MRFITLEMMARMEGWIVPRSIQTAEAAVEWLRSKGITDAHRTGQFLGVGEGPARALLRRMGHLPPAGPKRTPEWKRARLALALRLKGTMTLAAIGKELGVTPERVRQLQARAERIAAREERAGAADEAIARDELRALADAALCRAALARLAKP